MFTGMVSLIATVTWASLYLACSQLYHKILSSGWIERVASSGIFGCSCVLRLANANLGDKGHKTKVLVWSILASLPTLARMMSDMSF